jgi:hypothetical protein
MSPKKAVVDFEDVAEHWFIFSLFPFFLGRLTSRLRLTLTQLSVRALDTFEAKREEQRERNERIDLYQVTTSRNMCEAVCKNPKIGTVG